MSIWTGVSQSGLSFSGSAIRDSSYLFWGDCLTWTIYSDWVIFWFWFLFCILFLECGSMIEIFEASCSSIWYPSQCGSMIGMFEAPCSSIWYRPLAMWSQASTFFSYTSALSRQNLSSELFPPCPMKPDSKFCWKCSVGDLFLSMAARSLWWHECANVYYWSWLIFKSINKTSISFSTPFSLPQCVFDAWTGLRVFVHLHRWVAFDEQLSTFNLIFSLIDLHSLAS